MFKNAARKIAHNTTVPGLAGKQDLRSLQDLITAEKAVLNSFQRLSVDFARASDALRVWGQGEGDDLGDTLIASNAVLLHFAAALSALANHEGAIREQMKAVRTREENLDELKRRRKSVISDADGAERKLAKMSPENKNLQQQTDLLNRLRDEIRQMDAEIMAEEANLGDFKRSSVRSWMGRKFGGLLECCEKGSIVGDIGKLIILEIPVDETQPGMPRPYYAGHARTEFLVAEATRSVGEVTFSPEPDPNPAHRSIRPLPGSELPPVLSSPQQPRRPSLSAANGGPFGQPSGPTSPTTPYGGLPPVEQSDFSISQFMASDQPPQFPNPSISEFGSFSSPPLNQPSSFSVAEREKPTSPRGGRFATFPVKALGPRPQPGVGSSYSTNPYISSPPMQESDRAPSIEIDRGGHDESFSSSVAQALSHSLDGSSSVAGPSSNQAAAAAPRDVKDGADFGPQRYSPPPPVYTPSNGQGLPIGAAPSQPPSAMQSGPGTLDVGNGKAPLVEEDDEEDVLAYMSPRLSASHESLPDVGDRRVRFGGVSDVEQELEKRHQEQDQIQASPPRVAPGGSHRVPVPSLDAHLDPASGGRVSPEVQRPQPASPSLSDSASRGRSPAESPQQEPPPPPRAPTPPAADLLDEKSLNAAAALEVSRELDALMMSSTPPESPVLSQPFGNRAQFRTGIPPWQRQGTSPLPSINTGRPNGSQPTSPKLEGMYVRERDRSVGSPGNRAPTQDTIPAPSSPSLSSDGDQTRPAVSLPRASPALSTDTNGTPFRTPMTTPLAGPPPSSSMYSLPGGLSGSNTSFNSGGTRTISAAAFRRPQPQIRNMSVDSAQSDVSPLNVKKRALPSSPYPPQQQQMLQPGVPAGMRSASPSNAPSDYDDRPVSHYRQDDDFDYISAYTDDRASQYIPGRAAPNVDDGDGIR